MRACVCRFLTSSIHAGVFFNVCDSSLPVELYLCVKEGQTDSGEVDRTAESCQFWNEKHRHTHTHTPDNS